MQTANHNFVHQEKEAAAPLLIDSIAAAKLLGIGTRTLWQLTNDGEVPYVRIGRSVRYHVPALHEWVAAKLQRPSAAQKSCSPQLRAE